eukprot:scaffold427_cov263-Pinguiococcus_pyrenoidosus.AAC.7
MVGLQPRALVHLDLGEPPPVHVAAGRRVRPGRLEVVGRLVPQVPIRRRPASADQLGTPAQLVALVIAPGPDIVRRLPIRRPSQVAKQPGRRPQAAAVGVAGQLHPQLDDAAREAEAIPTGHHGRGVIPSHGDHPAGPRVPLLPAAAARPQAQQQLASQRGHEIWRRIVEVHRAQVRVRLAQRAPVLFAVVVEAPSVGLELVREDQRVVLVGAEALGHSVLRRRGAVHIVRTREEHGAAQHQAALNHGRTSSSPLVAREEAPLAGANKNSPAPQSSAQAPLRPRDSAGSPCRPRDGA